MSGTPDKEHGSNDMRWSPMAVLSFLFHLAVFSIILFIPESSPTRPVKGMVYEVHLVEMPSVQRSSPKGSRSSTVKKTKKESRKRDTARRIKSKKKESKPLVIAKRSVKKKTTTPTKPKLSSSQLIDRAISRVERTVQSDEKSHVDQAISKLESALGPTGYSDNRGAGLAGMVIRIYQAEVEQWIKSNWSYPVALQGQEDLEAIVVVMVKRDGTIVKSHIEKRSENKIFDQSVIRAVERSDPLPPFPDGYRKSHDEIEITFNLKELEAR
jgi:colicin import membrane protein